MAEEGQPQETETIKTASDLKLEELMARMDKLEAENRELRDANKELYNAARERTAEAPTVSNEPTFSQVGAEAQTGPDETMMETITDNVFASWHLQRTKE